MSIYARVLGDKEPAFSQQSRQGHNLAGKEEKMRKNDKFFASIQKITTFACLFGEKP